ncbi:unnamed protein product [Caenorhabditis auriculariae]|uniref:Cytoplasmic dynein 2 heavy chain 1 n=1 Tax=Caenorhabditis auriculariae TaxID=2777116 RepID=A0A8S1H6L7_9PELO|nr:unnamed protein product [Caenorhabditis auriculariae]
MNGTTDKENAKEKGDVRKIYILRVASYILGLNITEDKLKNTQPLDTFCDTNTNLLVVARTDQKVELWNRMRHDGSKSLRVVFYKTHSTTLSNENYKMVVNVISINGALNQVFLKSVQNVFGKELSEQAAANKQLVTAVNELEESLLATVENGQIEGESWKNKSDSAAREYTEVFKDFQVLLDTMQERDIHELAALVESFEDTADELWNCQKPYPQAKMKVLIDAMAIDVCEQFELTVSMLTAQTWKRSVENPWEGDAVHLKFLEGFRGRLQEVLSLKSLGPQMASLLEEKNVDEEVSKTIETALRGMSPLAYNPFTQPNWKSRVLVAERSIEGVIDRTLPVLKQRLTPSDVNNQNIATSLEKYRNFLCRANIKEKLRTERETLLSRLTSMMNTKDREFQEKINMIDVRNFHFLTEVGAKIVWIRQQITQLENVKTLSTTVLNDLPTFETFSRRLDESIEKLHYAERENFDDWCRDTVQMIDDQNDSIALETTGKIMVFEEANGELNVNYSDRLLRLIKEVRQLTSLGLNVPSKIVNCANNGEKYHHYGVTLKQIAHFYNTIDQQMLPCQQALMLEEAIAFEKLVIPRKNEESAASRVTWDNPKQLEEFIRQLQAAEEKLANHNRRLRNVHTELTGEVAKLMDLNIVKQSSEWKEIIAKLRGKMKEEELAHGSSRTNMRPWLIHWDHQLYKALKIQYEWGIESIQSQMAAIQVQLVFADQRIQLRPALEEIRSKYYKELTKFLRIPEKFRGTQEDEVATRFYGQMIDRSMHLLPTIYEKAEQLMEKIATVDQQFVDWLVVAQVDLEELIEEKLHDAADWEVQFKLLKSKAREAERLPNELKLECVVVSTTNVKGAIEEAVRRVFDTLSWTLRHSISTTSATINAFLTHAIEVLSSRPQSIDEIAEANVKHTQFAETNKKLKAEWKTMEEQHTLLRSVAGSGVEQMAQLEQMWERFDLMLDSHQLMIKDQALFLSLQDEAEKLKARWDQFKPKSDALQGDREAMLNAIKFIKEKREQWQELVNMLEKLEKECAQFSLPPPQVPLLESIDNEIKDFEDNWLIYETFNEQLDELSQEEWIVFRGKTYLFDEFLQKWMEKLKTSSHTHMSVRLMKDVEQFKELSGCLKFCRGDVLSADHWLEMFRLLGLPRGTTIEKLKFADLLSVSRNILDNLDQLKALNSRAQGEVSIREAIQELTLWAAQAEFSLTDYKHSSGTAMKVIKDWKEAINSVKDSQALLQSLKSSPYYSQFTDKTAVWETRLADLDVFLAQMNEIQRKWIYLEPIFGRGALPSEASRFARVDSEYRGILNDVARDPRLASLCNRQSLKKTLEQIVDQLNRCQKALNQFLEQKRSAFPRFYFVGDDDLLEILGQSTNAVVIQTHMKKLFQGINKVIFSSNNESITAIVSAEEEVVPLSRPVQIVAQVEIWLQQLSDEMRRTIKSLCVQACSEASPSLAKYPSQVLCLAEEIRFCTNIEQILEGSKNLGSFKSQLQEQLKTYTSRKDDDAVIELKLKALILDLIHRIDVVDQLVGNKASSTSCWTWQRQLRFYLVNDQVVVRQVYSEFEYTYEYQGNYAKLVHTPLTDKCYLTLTQAMYMGLGGNPYGPAGTGKTESVKALSALMGRQVLVFNCDEGIDVHSMSRIFTGIVECGAWGCFDEFNRLDSTVLSAVSMQIQTIQGAIKSRVGSCVFANKTVQVNPNSAIFITLNPAGKGYGGRQKMPDNLKQLFRAVVMGVPDNELIAETILYSEGFTEANVLARKIVAVFKLSKEMLSKQQHYDWGLRALKTVLRGCGALRRSSPQKSETDVVVQALLLNTLSKLTFSDSKRFSSLIDDIFSSVDKQMAKYDKVFQLYEQLRQRMGVVVVGASGSGKTTIWRVLQRALLILKTPLQVIAFNPKAVARNKLLGHMDVDTREWSDGILTMAARDVIKDTSVHRWIVCDGDIDPEWVEALNSVLDDNRLLTMPSGERIQFGSNVNFIFETDSLKFASPATVSRMGMIYISEEDVSPEQIVSAWLRSNKDEMHADMASWIENFFFKSFKWARSNAIPEVTSYAILKNGLTHLKNAKAKLHFQLLLYTGLAPMVLEEKRQELAKTVIFQGVTLPDSQNPQNIYYDDRLDTLMSFTDDTSQDIRKEDVEREEFRPFVLTADAQRYRDLQDPDSQMATVYCSAQSNSSHLLHVLQQNCFQASNPQGRVLRPKEKTNLIFFLKSIHLPAADKYGTNELLAFLEQLLAYQGFYDHNLEWISIENIQFVGSMPAMTEGTKSLPARLMSLMRCASFGNSNETQLTTIYSAFLTPILEDGLHFAKPLRQRAIVVLRMAFTTPDGSFLGDLANFRPADNVCYSFSPRDLTNLVLSLLRHDATDATLDVIIAFEARRIFCDRLTSDAHKQKFEDILRDVVPNSKEKLFVSTGTVVKGESNVGLPLSEMNVDGFMSILHKSVNRFEFEVANFASMLTEQFSLLCAYVDRSLTSPGGNLLLAGRPGVGRRDAIRLVAHMHQLSLFSPAVTPNFGPKHFDNELKNAITTAVTNGEHVVLLLEDHQMRQSVFLQSINSLLASGNVPGLFNQQETDGLAAIVSEAASQAAFSGHLHQFLAHRIRSLVHVVLIFDVDSDDFTANIAQNPSILKHCNIIFSDRLERKSLTEIPALLLAKNKIEVSDSIIGGFGDTISALPQNLALPMKFRQFVENFADIYNEKKTAVSARLQRLEGGVSKLNEAREEVAKMQKKAAKKSKLLAEKQAEADEALKAITESMTGAEDQKTSMEQLKIDREKENVRIAEQKVIIDEQLKEVEPMLREAREAVGSIKSESLSEIRSLRAPPESIRDILQAVLLFMGILDTSWEAMRKFLSKSGVKDDIINFDAHRITSDVHKKVSALVKAKAASFDSKARDINAKRASVAAAPLAAWVLANLQYSQILEKISPLENEKNKLLKNLAKAEKQMESLSKGLQSVDETVAELKKKIRSFDERSDSNQDRPRQRAAGTLVESLSGEFARWQQQMGVLSEELKQVEKCAIITSAFVTYLGSCSEKQRTAVLKDICSLFGIPTFSPLAFASLETEQLNWKTKGLPSDVLSMENAMILFNTVHVPLVIDPSGQVSAFLNKYIEKSELLKAAQNDLMTKIELAIRFGKTIIVDDLVDFDATLLPILRKDCSSQGPRQVISFAGKQIDYNPEFRLFLCTRNDQVRLRSNVSSLLCHVNFTTTASALSAQLLGAAMRLEKPELEGRSSELLRDAESKRLELEKLEQLLLQQLASSQGNLLENSELLASLNKSKENAETISKSIEESEQLHKQLSAQKDNYIPLSTFGSALFFSFSQLHFHNQMYNYSVNTILKLFETTIRDCKDTASSRVDSLARSLQLNVFNYVSRGIFKHDRLMFALNFIHASLPKMFLAKEWELFTGVLVDDSAEPSAASRISWVAEERTGAVAKLQTHLPSLFNTVQLHDQSTWAEFSKTLQCEEAFPPNVDSKITPFQKLLIIQAVRPDRLYNCMLNFVQKVLDIPSINPPAFSLKDVFQESEAKEPILLVLADGADPSQELQELANVVRIGYKSISMGQGQEEAAIEAINEAAKDGTWVCLNNVHLMLAVVPLIQKELSLLQPDAKFRLWMTTEADQRFPTITLQQCFKITFEPPPGVRNNLLRTYSQVEDVQRSVVTNQSIFVVAWLHALLQERRTYIPQAWTKFYEFGASDMRVAKVFVEQITLRKADWEFVRGILLYVIYGGRIENVFDGLVLNAYVQTLFNDAKITGKTGESLVRGIEIIASSSTKDYVAHIAKNVPAIDEPYMFGLPENIKYSWQLVQAEKTTSSMRNLALGGATPTLQNAEEAVAPIIALWKKLCQAGDVHKMNMPPEKDRSDALAEVLWLELRNALEIVQNVHNSLRNVSKSVRGSAVPSSTTTQTIQALVLHQTPDEWDVMWSGPRDPAEYLNSVVQKTKGTQQMFTAAESDELLSKPVDFSDLFRPTAFLNALRQSTSRAQSTPMDELKLSSAWDSSRLPSKSSIHVRGLLIQGATFDGILRETTESSPVMAPVPPLYLAWTRDDESTVVGEQTTVPLYVNSEREEVVARIAMPCREKFVWDMAAVALFLK